MEQTLGDIFTNYTREKTKHKCYRHEMIDKFMGILREPYFAFKKKELSSRQVAIKLSSLRDDELERFYAQCIASNNPSLHFWASFTDGHWKRREQWKLSTHRK